MMANGLFLVCINVKSDKNKEKTYYLFYIFPVKFVFTKNSLIVSDDVQNLFSLMDFGGDGKIKYEEYMRATMHYRRLGMLLSIDFLPAHRKCLVQKFKAVK